MGRGRFKMKKHVKTPRALIIVCLVALIALGIIGVVARKPVWSLLPDEVKSKMEGGALVPNSDGSYGELDADEWVLPAIVVVVMLSGGAAWIVFIKAYR
jgi:hypothetical protein